MKKKIIKKKKIDYVIVIHWSVTQLEVSEF